MELYCEQERLGAALKAVLPAVPSRSWATAEAGMLLRADGHLSVIATDREMTIRCQVGAQVAKSGEVVLPARTISDLVALLDPDRVDVFLDEEAGVLALRCGRTLAHVRGWKAEDFPELPVPAGDPIVRMEAQTLRDAVGRVAYAASNDASRATLCCVLMQFRDDQVTLVAADGFRLARCAAPLVVPVGEPLDLVVPAAGLRELQKLTREGEVTIFLDGGKRHAIFETGESTVGCLLGGKFPDYEQIIPQEWNARAVVDRDALRRACRTARAMHADCSSPSECGALRVEFAEDRFVVTATSVEVGENRTELEAEMEGEQVEVSLNVRYLADTAELRDFVRAHARQMADLILARHRPLYNFDANQAEWRPMDHLSRHRYLPGRVETGLMKAQKHVTVALARLLRLHGAAILNGQMGYGKTTVAAALPVVLRALGENAYPVLVASP